MTEDHRPLNLNPPTTKHRAALPKSPPRFAELLPEQKKVGEQVRNKLKPLTKRFYQLSSEQKKAVFLKITHNEMRIDLSGTGLRVFADGDTVTLATVKEGNLDKLLKKLNEFENSQPERGHLKNEALFFPITDLAEGDPLDRLSAEMFENYHTLIEEDSLLYEIELMTDGDGQNKKQQETLRDLLLEKLQATITINGTIFEHETVGPFIRVMLRTSGKVFQKFVEEPAWRTKIIRFEYAPDFETFHTIVTDFSVGKVQVKGPDKSAATICVVDSGVTENNQFLKPVVRSHLSKSFVKDNSNPSDEYNHGSGVASLAAFQDINISRGAVNEAGSWIAGARILDANNHIEGRLLSAVLRDVVEEYVKHGIRIFNLSVCVKNKPWNEPSRRAAKRSSWVARQIDKLSKEFDVVFVISAGNLTLNAVTDFMRNQGALYPTYFQSEDCKILDPSQASLAITVGSIVGSTTVVASGNSTPIAGRNLPSPFTRVGPGLVGEIKPELVEIGGNWVHVPGTGNVTTNYGLDLTVANNKITPAIHHGSGTSYAAARVSFKLAKILCDLSVATSESYISAPLLRAFLVNSASIKRTNSKDDEITQFAASFSSVGSLARILGYGTPDQTKAVFGDAYTVTCYFQGDLSVDDVAFFRIPVPVELKNSTGDKLMHITVAFAPDVHQSGLKDYLGSRLKWRLFRGDSTESDILNVMSKVDESSFSEESALDDEIDLLLEGEDDSETDSNVKELKKSRFGIQARSKGTVQHDVFKWTQHKEHYSKNDYILAVSLYKRWSSKQVPFAVVVRIEDTSNTVPIYSKVRARLLATQVRAKT